MGHPAGRSCMTILITLSFVSSRRFRPQGWPPLFCGYGRPMVHVFQVAGTTVSEEGLAHDACKCHADLRSHLVHAYGVSYMSESRILG